MGSRSRSSSSNTSGATSSTMGNLSKNRVSNEAVAGMQQGLANSQLGSTLGVVDALVRNGHQMFGDNIGMKIMGGMFGMPIQMQTPDFLSEFINKYNPPEPQQPQQPQPPQMPNYMGGMGQTGIGTVPFNINEYMRNQNLGR
jgi:hypothetical protein